MGAGALPPGLSHKLVTTKLTSWWPFFIKNVPKVHKISPATLPPGALPQILLWLYPGLWLQAPRLTHGWWLPCSYSLSLIGHSSKYMCRSWYPIYLAPAGEFISSLSAKHLQIKLGYLRLLCHTRDPTSNPGDVCSMLVMLLQHRVAGQLLTKLGPVILKYDAKSWGEIWQARLTETKEKFDRKRNRSRKKLRKLTWFNHTGVHIPYCITILICH